MDGKGNVIIRSVGTRRKKKKKKEYHGSLVKIAGIKFQHMYMPPEGTALFEISIPRCAYLALVPCRI